MTSVYMGQSVYNGIVLFCKIKLKIKNLSKLNISIPYPEHL